MMEKYILEFKDKYNELIAAHEGNPSLVPASDVFEIHERLRARMVIDKAKRDSLPVVKTLRDHGVDNRIIADVWDGQEEIAVAKNKSGKKAKEDAITKIKEMAGKTVSLNELADETGLTYAQVSKIAKDRPDLMTKVKKGSYLLRNPDVERKAEKA